MGRKSSTNDSASRLALAVAWEGGIETRGRVARAGRTVVEIAVSMSERKKARGETGLSYFPKGEIEETGILCTTETFRDN
jgi:hypothetical protein